MLGDGVACDGDSESSVYDQVRLDRGEWVSFGVLSRGDVSPDAKICMQPVYVRLDAWGQLLVNAATKAAARGGYPLPAWAADAGLTDGNSCSVDGQCLSDHCVASPADSGVSASPCSGGWCASGFSCRDSYCLADERAPSSHGCSSVPQTRRSQIRDAKDSTPRPSILALVRDPRDRDTRAGRGRCAAPRAGRRAHERDAPWWTWRGLPCLLRPSRSTSWRARPGRRHRCSRRPESLRPGAR
jgi:hypothetical protein